MVQDKIEFQPYSQSTDALQILRRRQHLVQTVVYNRKAAVEICVENTGENIKRTESIFTAAFQQICNVT